jgi:hypothetical protein
MEIGKGRRHDAGDDGGDGGGRVSKKRVGWVGGVVWMGWRGHGAGEGRHRAVDPWGEGVRRRSGGAGWSRVRWSGEIVLLSFFLVLEILFFYTYIM